MKLFIFLIVGLVVGTEAYRGYNKRWRQRKPICEPLECGPNCKEVPVDNACPKCECGPMCSVPDCPKGCELKENFEGPCPGCDCEVEAEFEEGIIEPRKRDFEGVRCSPPKCPPGCEIEIDFEGPCPGCKCGKDDIPDLKPPCYPPKCPPGCKIEIDFEGPCPGCKCEKDEIPDKIIPTLQCSHVSKCPPGCKLEKDFDAPCPGCKCEKDEVDFKKPIPCSPPKCDPGCEIEIDFEGPCPGCKCEIPEPPLERSCDPVKCLPGCKEEKGESGCPICVCGVKCDPPKCGPGCEIETDPKGVCPECICKEDIPPKKEEPPLKIDCDPVKCLPGCREKIESSGCPICVCGVKCDPPNCGPGCEIETDPKGVCPECICKEDIPPKKEEDVKKDCPVMEDCSKPGCETKVDEAGCDICECKPICDPPKCPRRCKIDYKGECPKCICKKFHWG